MTDEEKMTARKIIEARLGRELPSVEDMPKDQRTAVLRLGLELIKAREHVNMPKVTYLDQILGNDK